MPPAPEGLRAVPGDILELADDSARSSVSVVPARGAIVTRFRVGDRELLFLDEATLRDPAKNVRGGIPVLFPSPGRLTGDCFVRGARSGAMKQHGFARDLPWTVRSVAVTDAATATLTLRSTETTRAMFPWTFDVELQLRLIGTRLTIDVAVHNDSTTEPLPFAFGLHPYFVVKDKSRVTIATRATQAFDNVTKRVVPFRGFDFGAGEVDLHLLDHGSSRSELAWGDGTRLELEGSADFTRWVVWSLPDRDFVCVEPWTAPGDALNTGEGLLEVAPGATHRLSFAMTYVPAAS